MLQLFLSHISREVHLGHNKTCTLKPQQWHNSATSREYSVKRISNIPIKKVKTERDSFLKENKQELKRSVFDSRAFHHRSPMVCSAKDWLKLGDATDENCGIFIYKASRDKNKLLYFT